MYRITVLLFLAISILACKSTKNITNISEDAPDYYIADTDVNYIRAYADSKEDSDINNLIAPYKVELSKEMDITIGTLPMDIKKGKPNSSMGNWFCDLLLDATERIHDDKVDFALQNYGGLRIPSISKGPISKGKIFELMPFDNKLVILSLSSEQLQALCNLIAEDGGWPLSRGLEMSIDRPNALATDIKIRGKEIDSQSKYHVAIPDYIANGGGGAEFLKIIPQHDTGYFIRDVIIEQLEIMMENDTEISIDDTKRIK